MMRTEEFTFQEFFAGGGMVRQALGSNWNCLFANDFDGKKALAYQDNWGTNGELLVGNIRDVPINKLAKKSDLAWASFPCQDLSLAGKGNGLKGERSSMFYVFWEKLKQAAIQGEMPAIVVIENVCGMLTSNNGEDFNNIIRTFSENNYHVGGLVIDAKDFVPQSRKRREKQKQASAFLLKFALMVSLVALGPPMEGHLDNLLFGSMARK